jgi:ATP-binding cassette, subfamily F, member 2
MAPKNKSKKFLAAQKVREGEQKVKNGGVETMDNSDAGSTITVSSNGSAPGIKKSALASIKDVGQALPTTVDVTRSATGVLHSLPTARDIKIGSFSLNYHGKMLVEDAMIELTVGRRYGLIGRNGCGKSTFLKTLAAREVPIPEHIDIYLLSEEAQPSNDTALEYVVNSAKEEVARLENQIEHLLTEQGPECDLLQPLYDRLDELDPATFEPRAATILCGLGFNAKTIKKRTCDMSGGWRMRVALARALFIQPTMLLLDEPTNHLDLNACVWLEEYLSRYDKILVIVSHSQDFLDGVCTDTMVMQRQKLDYWGGNYSTYVKTRREQDVNQLKMYKKQQDEIKHIKQFIASCGTYSNLVRQAKSRQKQLDKMVEAGLIEAPFEDILFKFRFPSCGTMAPPLISFSDAAFSYSGKKADYLYSGISFGIDSDSRISIVGPNGAGKSTLLNLMVNKLTPTEGSVSHKSGLRVGRYHQHTADQLDFNISPIEYLRSKFPGLHKEIQGWRGEVGKFGITGDAQLAPIGHLSDGMKTRLAFAEIGLQKPHILLLDEPTNAFDMEGIDALAEAINEFEGGVVLVSHDFRLLSQVAREIWVVDHGLSIWDGDIASYKESLKKGMKW